MHIVRYQQVQAEQGRNRKMWRQAREREVNHTFCSDLNGKRSISCSKKEYRGGSSSP